ncbi:hypothetical protein BgiMline_033975, partial [Biomphalaria glabrata]
KSYSICTFHFSWITGDVNSVGRFGSKHDKYTSTARETIAQYLQGFIRFTQMDPLEKSKGYGAVVRFPGVAENPECAGKSNYVDEMQTVECIIHSRASRDSTDST